MPGPETRRAMLSALRKALRTLLIYIVGKPFAYPTRRRLWAFETATHDPRRVQEALLQNILAFHRQTTFGRDHGFAGIHTIDDFRRQLLVATYDYIEPYI